MRDFYDPIYGSYQAPPAFQGPEHSKKSRSGSGNGNVFGRFLKLGKSKSDAHGYSVKSRSKPSQQYDLEEDFRLTSTSKSPVERMVYKVNNRKDVSKSHSWIYGSVKLPSDLPFGYGHGYSPGTESMHNPRSQTSMDYCGGMCECSSSEFTFHQPEATSPHPHHPSGIPFENNNCHACHTPAYAVSECCKHPPICPSSKHYPGNSQETGKKFASSVRKLTWKSLKQVVKKRPTLDVLKKPNPRVPVNPLNQFKEEVVCSPDGLLRSNYFFPDKKAFYASCTDVYGESPQHMTASVRVRPKRSRQPWPFPNEFGPVPNYQEEEIYHSEWDLRQFLPYDVWIAASNNPYQSPSKCGSKNPKTNRHSNDPAPLAITDATTIPPTNSAYMGDEGSSSGCNNNNYPSRSKSAASSSMIYGCGQTTITRSSILQTDVTAYQLIKSKKVFPNKNPLEDDQDDPTDSSDELSDNVISEDPVRIGGQGIYMIPNVHTNPVLNTACKSPSSIHSQSNESNEKSHLKAIVSTSRGNKSLEGTRSDMNRMLEFKESVRNLSANSPQQPPKTPERHVPTTKHGHSGSRDQLPDKFNKLPDSNNFMDPPSYTVNNPSSSNSANKIGLKTYLSQPVDNHSIHFGGGNVTPTSNSSNSPHVKKFNPNPRIIMNDVSGNSYESNHNNTNNATKENRQRYLSDFEAFEFQDSKSSADSQSYSLQKQSKETHQFPQTERDDNWSNPKTSSRTSPGLSKGYFESSHQDPDDWSGVGEDSASSSRTNTNDPRNSLSNLGNGSNGGKGNIDNNGRGSIDNNGRASIDNNGRGSIDNNGRGKGENNVSSGNHGALKRRKLRSGHTKSKSMLKETIYEEESENSDNEWASKQVYAVKIVVSQNVASEYVKPILKKDRVYETPCVDNRPGQANSQLPYNTTGSGTSNTGSDLCGEGQSNTATRSTKKVQFDSSKLVVLGGPADDHDDDYNESDEKESEDKQDEWIVEEDSVPSSPTHTQNEAQEIPQSISNSSNDSNNEVQQNFYESSEEHQVDERINALKLSGSRLSSVSFESTEAASPYGEETRSYNKNYPENKCGNNNNTSREKLAEASRMQYDQALSRVVEKRVQPNEPINNSPGADEEKNIQQVTNAAPFSSSSKETRNFSLAETATANNAPSTPNQQLQQRLVNLNSLLFHDTTRIRLNQSRPSLEQAFNFNKTPLGGERNLQGSRNNKLMPRLKQSSSFRQPGASLLRPREPPPPPPIPRRETSLPSYRDPRGTNSRVINSTKLQEITSFPTRRPANNEVQQERSNIARTSADKSFPNGSSATRRAQISSEYIAPSIPPRNSPGQESNSTSPPRPNTGLQRNASEESKIISKIEPYRNLNKSLADRCKSLEKLISQRSLRPLLPDVAEKETKGNGMITTNHPKFQDPMEPPVLLRAHLPATPMEDNKPKEPAKTNHISAEEPKSSSVNQRAARSAPSTKPCTCNHSSYEDPKVSPKKLTEETRAIQGEVPAKSQTKDSKDKNYQPEQNIEIVTKENSVSEIRIYSTPQNLITSHSKPSSEPSNTLGQGQSKDSLDNKIEEIHYAASDILYPPRGQRSQSDDSHLDEASSKSRPQSTSVVLIISPKDSLPEEHAPQSDANSSATTKPIQHIYKRTNYEGTTRDNKNDFKQPDSDLVSSKTGSTNKQSGPNFDHQNSAPRKNQVEHRVDVAAANKNYSSNSVTQQSYNYATNNSTISSNNSTTTPSNNNAGNKSATTSNNSAAQLSYSTTAPSNTANKHSATGTSTTSNKYSATATSGISNKHSATATSTSSNKYSATNSVASANNVTKSDSIGTVKPDTHQVSNTEKFQSLKDETDSEANSEPLYDDVINYAARKAKRTPNEKRYSTSSVPQLFESFNKELSRNAATFTQNLLSKYSSKSLSSGELAQPLPPPPVPSLPPPKNILGKIGSGSIKSRRSVSDYPYNTQSSSSSSGSQQYEQASQQSNGRGGYNDSGSRGRLGTSLFHYKGNKKNDGLIYDDTLSIMSSTYGRSMVDGKVNGFIEAEFEDEEPLYDDVLNLLLPDSDSGVDTEDSPPPPLPAQGPPVHLTPRVSGELQALNFSLFPNNPQEKSALLRKSNESLQRTLEGTLERCEETARQDTGTLIAQEDKVLDRTRTLLHELSEKLNKLNLGPADYQTHISKVVVSSSPESSGVEEDYSSEKAASISNSSETPGFEDTSRLTAVSKLVSETISMARGKFLDSMKMNSANTKSSPNVSASKNVNPGVVPQSKINSVDNEEEPIYEEIGDMKPTSPIYADAFDVKNIFDGASRNEILSFLETLRDRLATTDSVEDHL